MYVTYSSSKEAIAAIQGVDGAVYEGRTLKASFGTTKYAPAAASSSVNSSSYHGGCRAPTSAIRARCSCYSNRSS